MTPASVPRRAAAASTLQMAALVCVPLAGCEGVQSTFSAFGEEAEAIRALTLGMAAAAAVITAAVLGLAVFAVRARSHRIGFATGLRLVLWCGGIVPAVALGTLLVGSLPTMRPLPLDDAALRIDVDAEQFWWRVRYGAQDGEIVTANEIRVPVGVTVAFELASEDVIHSFWIPGLAGKLDMIPGRVNELIARATRTGVYRGVCAEFCGLSHAGMAFDVEALEPRDFDAWLQSLAAPAAGVSVPGRGLFGEYGCQGCHAVRGHFAGSAIGPDLTHFAARRSLAAGTLPMTRAAIAAFIRDAPALKPGALMPSFPRMPAADADAIAAYLEALR